MQISLLVVILVVAQHQVLDINAYPSSFFSDCSLTIIRYHQCLNNLKMVLNESSDYKEYIPDKTIPNNSIRLNPIFNGLTLEGVLDLQFKIFNTSYNCSSQFCKCVNLTGKVHPGFKSLFENKSIFIQFKEIVRNYGNILMSLKLYPKNFFTERINRNHLCDESNLLFKMSKSVFSKWKPKCIEELNDYVSKFEFKTHLVFYICLIINLL